MTDRTLFFGSSLTQAFRQWHLDADKTDHREADIVHGHGGFWLPDLIVTTNQDYFRGKSYFLPKSFLVKPVLQPMLSTLMYAYGSGVKDHGHEYEINFALYDKVVFTTPMLFWDISNYTLFLQKRGLYNDDTKEIFDEAGHLDRLTESQFLEIHRKRFQFAYDFLRVIRTLDKDLPIWIAPAVLPSKARPEYSRLWKSFYWAEMRCVDIALTNEFGTIPMVQPEHTLDDDRCTLETFMADEQHHYNAQFVSELLRVYKF